MKIYLANPYTGSFEVQQMRFEAACEIAGRLMRAGHIVFSPIAHSHPISIPCGIPGNHAFWQAQNEGWLEWCDEVWVAMMAGWNKSEGVRWEIGWAEKHSKPVKYFPVFDSNVGLLK